jgi:hypothetical protein
LCRFLPQAERIHPRLSAPPRIRQRAVRAARGATVVS